MSITMHPMSEYAAVRQAIRLHLQHLSTPEGIHRAEMRAQRMMQVGYSGACAVSSAIDQARRERPVVSFLSPATFGPSGSIYQLRQRVRANYVRRDNPPPNNAA